MNRVALIGNLTKDPDLRHTPSGMAVCSMRVAVNTRRKDNTTGEWVDKPNYFDVTVWGNQGENCAQYLAKGRKVGVDGRLEWREWEAQDGSKRQAVEIIADSVEFLTPKGDGNFRPDQDQYTPSGVRDEQPQTEFAPAGADDDIPFAFIDKYGLVPVHSCLGREGQTSKLHVR